jgi:pimeloyl-ACP methyl ester carboxylesterase
MSRPALVLIPGLMCDQRIWAAQCDALRGLGIEFRVAEHGSADSLADMARAVLAANPGPLAVVGHSMGGRVALEIARLAGARLRGAALLDTGFRPLAPGDVGAREVAGRLRLLEQARGEGIRAMAASWVQGMVHPDRLQDRALIDAVLDMFERHSVAQFAAQIQALIQRPDASSVLPGIACPSLLLCGEQDQWATPAQHSEMAQLIPGSLYSCVPHCGHMSPMEQPAAVNAALLSWLELVDVFRPSAR